MVSFSMVGEVVCAFFSAAKDLRARTGENAPLIRKGYFALPAPSRRA